MKKFITFLVVLTTFLSTSYGQGGSVKGTVKDADGLALIGATVQVENTNTAVVTDLDGNYVLSGVPAGANLVFSYVGMESQTVAVAGKGVVDVSLASDSSELEEVVIIGYGTTTKRKAVGAVSAIDSEKIEASTYNDMQSALQGQVPGLFVTSSGASMNDQASVQIRGADGEPLYVIDGVISSANEFTMLNPADVESMSFLKDASATAVYGSQAGNGIVLVQTKRGTAGKAKVSYSGTFQISEPTMLPDYVSTDTYMNLYKEILEREGDESYLNITQDVIDAYPDNDWVSMIFRNFAFQQKHNVGVSGGTEDTKYYAAIGQYSNNGIQNNDSESMNRINFRANIVSEIDKMNMTFNASMNASLQNIISSPWQNYKAIYYLTPPNIDSYNPDGTVNNNPDNPLWYYDEDVYLSYTDQERNYLNAKMDLTWHPKSVKGLTAGVMAAYKHQNNFNRQWTAYGDVYSWDEESQTSIPESTGQTNALYVYSYYYKSVDFESRIAYNRTFGKHTIDALALYTQRVGSGDNVSAKRSGYLVTALDELNVGPETAVTTSGVQSMSGSQGLVFRAKYDYADKYIVEFSGRYDGNDDFADGYRWGFFPSVSGAWIVSDEAFMQPLVDNNVVSMVKLRGSWGQVGVSDSDNRYAYISGYETGTNFYANGAYQSTLTEGDLVDPANFSWYTRESTDIGLDVGFANNKFQFSGDYFYYETTGYTGSPADSYSTTLGTDLPVVVTDTEHRREGFELSLTYQNRFGDWDVMLSGNLTKYKELYAWDSSEDTSTSENPYTRTSQRDLSYLNLVYGTSGFYTSYDSFMNNARRVGHSDQEFGDLIYEDVDGDGQITSADMRYEEKPSSANLTYGLNFRVGWKDLSLAGLLQGTGTRWTYIGGIVGQGCYQYMVTEAQYDYWSEDNLDAKFPVPSSTTSNQNYALADVYYEDARYIRLKNLALTYNMTRLLRNVDFIDTMSVTFTGVNLLTWSPFFIWGDPEGDINDAETIAESGVSKTCPINSHSPIQRSYSVGINLTF